MAGTVAALAIVSALGVGAFRLALGMLPEYETRVAETIRTATGLRLSFDSLDARIGRYGPEIYFSGARIVDRDGGVLVTARAGRASLAVLRSLWFRRLEVGRIILDSPRLNLLIFPDRHVELVGQAGFATPPAQPRERRGLDRMPRGVFEIRDATVAFRDLAAGGATWELTHVDLEVSRQGSRIAAEGSVNLPAQLGRSLRFQGSVAGDLQALRGSAWQGRVAAEQVDAAGWARLLPPGLPLPTAGRGSFDITARGTGAALQEGHVVLQADGVTLPREGAAAPVTYSRLAGDLTLERDAEGWQLKGSGLDFSLPQSGWTPSDLDARLGVRDGRITRASLRAGFLRLENLTPLAALLAPAGWRERLAAYAPRGTLRAVNVGVVPVGAGQMPDFSGSASFTDLGFAPVGRAPGVAGLDGRFDGQGDHAVLDLDAAGVEMSWPGNWRSVRPLTTLRARVEFSRALGGVRIWVDDARVQAEHVAVTARARLLFRPGETPLMDVAAHAAVDDISVVPEYLPRERIGEGGLRWLDAAFVGGSVRDAELQLTGPAQGFPYRDGQGLFRVVADVENATLNYSAGWPQATGLDAHVEFTGPGMNVQASAGTVEGVPVHSATAEVADWRDGLLLIRADTDADAGAVHALLAASPLAPRLGDTFARLQAAGPIAGEVVLYLPIHDMEHDVVTVHGTAAGVSLALGGVAEPASGVSGEFWVRNREFYAPQLTAQLLGGKAQVAINSKPGAAGAVQTRIDASGTLDGSRLPKVVHLPLNAGLAGRTSWRASWILDRPGKPEAPTVSHGRLDSDLVGLASGLPAPLAKKADEARPLTIAVDSGGGDSTLVRASFGRGLRALLEFRRGADRSRLARGVIRLGGGDVSSLPVAPGLRVDGRVPYLSISDLTALEWPGTSTQSLPDLLTSVSLDVGRLEVLGYEFDGVSGTLRPGNHAWDVQVSAPAVQGSLLIPYHFPGDVPLVADLDRLNVPARARPPGSGETDPRSLPSLRVDVRDLTFVGRHFGHLTARLDHAADGVQLTAFSARQAAFEATGSGAWKATAAGSSCALQLKLASHDVRGLLQAMAMAPVIEAKKGELDADVSWPGAPDDTVLERISGKARIQLATGRMLSVEPGAGRILGLMSLSHLGKRLALDFKDLTGQGLAFDTVKGDFVLHSGEAYTDNLTLRGSAAEIGVAGRTDLRNRTYDQTAVVTGDLGASLGVAGALAGGPAVGAALLLFSQIFKEPLKGVVRAYYRISGPWDDPVVRKIDAHELGEAAGIGTPPPAPAPAPGKKGAG